MMRGEVWGVEKCGGGMKKCKGGAGKCVGKCGGGVEVVGKH